MKPFSSLTLFGIFYTPDDGTVCLFVFCIAAFAALTAAGLAGVHNGRNFQQTATLKRHSTQKLSLLVLPITNLPPLPEQFHQQPYLCSFDFPKITAIAKHRNCLAPSHAFCINFSMYRTELYHQAEKY